LAIFSLIFILVFSALDPEIIEEIPKVLNIIQFLVYFIQIFLAIALSTGFAIAYSVYGMLYSLTAVLAKIPILNLIVAALFGFTIDSTGNIGGMPGLSTFAQISQWSTELATQIFPHPTLSDEQLVTVIEDFINVLAFLAIGVCFAVAIFSVIGFVTRGEANLAMISFLSLQIIVILAIYIRRINISMVIPTSPFNDPNVTIGSDVIGITIEALLELIMSPVFMLGLLLYLMLEFSFQSSYAMNIIDPMVARGKRISGHLTRVMNYVPEQDKQAGEVVSLSAAMKRKYGILAASYVKEMIEKRMFKKKKGDLDPKSMMRLQGYIAQIRTSDTRFDEKITARSAAAKSKNIALYFIPMIIIRISIVVLISFIILNPTVILDPLSNMGLMSLDSLLESMELYEPEFRTIFLFNIALAIIVAGYLLKLRYAKKEKEEKVIQKIETLVELEGADEENFEDEETGDEDIG